MDAIKQAKIFEIIDHLLECEYRQVPAYREGMHLLNDHYDLTEDGNRSYYLAGVTCHSFITKHMELSEKDTEQEDVGLFMESAEENFIMKKVLTEEQKDEIRKLFDCLVSYIRRGENPDERGCILYLALLRYLFPAEEFPSIKSFESSYGGAFSKGGKQAMHEIMNRIPVNVDPLKQHILPSLPATKTKNFSFLNDAIFNDFWRYDYDNATGPQPVKVANKSKQNKKEIVATLDVVIMMDLEPYQGMTITNMDISPFEQVVSDTVCSLYQAAINKNQPAAFTLDTIYAAMPGSGEKPSEKQKKSIAEAIEKLRRRIIHVDATDYFRKKGIIGPSEKFKVDGSYFNVTHAAYITENGAKHVDAYKLEAEPIFLQISKLTKQILTTKAENLAIKKMKKNGAISTESMPMTAERQTILAYLARRILVMKHDASKQSNTIRFSTLFTDTMTKTTNRKQLMLYRNFVFDVLNYWTATGFIKGYEKQTYGRSITGVTIDLSSTKK